MTMPRKVRRIAIVLCAFAAMFGLWLGEQSRPSETDVINAGADLYVAETGRSRTECVGVPADPVGWIEVRCGDGTALTAYLFDRKGQLIAQPQEPQT